MFAPDKSGSSPREKFDFPQYCLNVSKRNFPGRAVPFLHLRDLIGFPKVSNPVITGLSGDASLVHYLGN